MGIKNQKDKVSPRTPFGYWAAFRIPLIAIVAFIPVRKRRANERELSRVHWIEKESALCDFRYRKSYAHIPAKSLEDPRYCEKCKKKLAKRERLGEKIDKSRRL